MDLLLIIVGMILLIFSIIDWRVKAIPSIFLTAMLFTVAFLYPANLWFGVMAFIMAYLLYEAEFFSGVADIKIMTMVGFMIPTMMWLMIYIGLIMVFGFVWKLVIKWRIRKEKETAFVPVFLFVYLALWILGGLA
jgi:hypothetical protein